MNGKAGRREEMVKHRRLLFDLNSLVVSIITKLFRWWQNRAAAGYYWYSLLICELAAVTAFVHWLLSRPAPTEKWHLWCKSIVFGHFFSSLQLISVNVSSKRPRNDTSVQKPLQKPNTDTNVLKPWLRCNKSKLKSNNLESFNTKCPAAAAVVGKHAFFVFFYLF